MTDDNNIVNFERHRDDLVETEIDAEVNRIIEELTHRKIDLFKTITIAISLLAKILAMSARDGGALKIVIKGSQRELQKGAFYYFKKLESGR